MKTVLCSPVLQLPARELLHVHLFSGHAFSLRNFMHKMHVGKPCIGVIMCSARNPCGKGRLKPAFICWRLKNRFHLLNSTAISSASTLHFFTHISIGNLLIKVFFFFLTSLHFCTHISIRNLLFKVPCSCLYIFDEQFCSIQYLKKK